MAKQVRKITNLKLVNAIFAVTDAEFAAEDALREAAPKWIKNGSAEDKARQNAIEFDIKVARSARYWKEARVTVPRGDYVKFSLNQYNTETALRLPEWKTFDDAARKYLSRLRKTVYLPPSSTRGGARPGAGRKRKGAAKTPRNPKNENKRALVSFGEDLAAFRKETASAIQFELDLFNKNARLADSDANVKAAWKLLRDAKALLASK